MVYGVLVSETDKSLDANAIDIGRGAVTAAEASCATLGKWSALSRAIECGVDRLCI